MKDQRQKNQLINEEKKMQRREKRRKKGKVSENNERTLREIQKGKKDPEYRLWHFVMK